MLSLGSSVHWSEALYAMTGEKRLDASAFLEYFQPLQDWLIKTNKELGVQTGWELSDSKIRLSALFIQKIFSFFG
jgi:peptidyl-dipeptidase A